MLKHYTRRKWSYAAFLFISLLAVGSYYQISNQQKNTRLTLKDQVSLYEGMSYDEIQKMPKYDRPDMAVMQNFNMTKDPALNDVPVARTVQAFEEIKAQRFTRAAIQGISWEERGPNNVGGRTRALMFDPNDGTNRKVWAGSVGGGLWFNNDITSASSQWQNVDDFWANLAITTIAYDPSNTQTFYAGTGEGFFNADAIRGAGIWKTTNGGSTWTQLSSTDNSDFFFTQKVAVTSSGTVLATTHTGLYRSTNGGTSWTQVLSGGRFADIEIASNGDIYASRGIFSPGSVFKSTNDGVSFSDVTPATGGERIELAIAPSNPLVLYAVASTGSNVAWFRKTTNGGNSWTTVTIPRYLEQNCSTGTQDFTRGQAWYDLIMAVQPNNPDIVLVGGIDIHRSTNGGSSWSSVSYWTGNCRSFVHADQHAMVFRPGSANTAIFGHDGGVSYSTNVGNAGATPSFSNRINNYNVTQFYAADQINASGSNYLLAGAQDNGSQRINTAGLSSSVEVSGGDGAFCHVDQDNSSFQITSFVFNSFFRSTNGGSSFSSILQNQDFGRFINPTDYDDAANILYSAANEDQFIRISGITGSTNPELLNVSLGGFSASALKVSPYTSNRLFIGTGTTGATGGSKVFRIDNANGTNPTSTEISTASIPGNGFISSIEIGSSDNQILVTLSNYGIVSVWETRNGGASWVNREGNLPDIPIRWGLYNPNNTNEVLLATELGVWSTDNINVANPNWGVTNTGLANVRTDMLQYRESDGQVVVATHGRGMYTAQPFSGGGGDTTPPSTPTGLSASNVTATSFNVSWNASSDNVGVANYTISLNGSVSGTTASTNFSFTGLSASTNYTVSVVANDAAGNSSSAASTNVTTTPAAISCSTSISSFPYSESFEGTLGVWNQSNTDDIDWTINSGGTPSNGTGPTGAFDGSSYIYMEVSGDGAGFPNKRAILTSSCIDFAGQSGAAITFNYQMTGSAVGRVDLEVSTDNGVTWTSIWNRSGDQGANWNAANVSLGAYSGSTIVLRFNGVSGNSWQGDIAIDNLEITVAPPADTQAPTAPQNLSASSVTTSGFNVNWSASSDNVGVTGYTVYLDGSEISTTANTSFSFTGLAASTTYAVAVEANDAAGNSSLQSSINVTTNDVPPVGISCASTVSNFPYNEGFEGGSTGDWVQATGDDGNWVNFTGSTPSSGTGPTSADEGSRYLYLEASTNGTAGQIGSNATAILESPCFDLSGASSADFNFKYHMLGADMGTLRVEVTTDGTTYTEIWSRSGDQGNAWFDESLSLAAYVGSTIKIRFRGTTGASWRSDMAIDAPAVTTGGSTGGGNNIPCSLTISSFPYSESFESGNGTWVQATGDDGDWVNDAGGTPSSGTGPSSATDGSFYMFLEASTNNSPGQIGSNATAILESPCLDLNGLSAASFNFSYHMLGTDMGTLAVDVTTDGSTWTEIWTRSGDQGNAWFNESLSLAAYLGNTIKVRFRGTTGSSWRSDMAIDNISVSNTTSTAALISTPSSSFEDVENIASIEVFPNPVVDELRIKMEGFDASQFTVISISGQVLRSGSIDKEAVVDMTQLPAGYYFVKIDHIEGSTIEKILKR